MEDIWKGIRTPMASQHFITGYKNLLAQDKHEFKFKKKQDTKYNTPLSYAVGLGLLGIGYKAKQVLNELTQTQKLKIEEMPNVLENIFSVREGEIRDEMRTQFEEESIDMMGEINRLQAIVDEMDDISSIGSVESSFTESEDIPPPMEIQETAPPPMGEYKDAEKLAMFRGGFRKGGKVEVDDMLSYEKGGVVEENFSKSLYKSDCKQDCENENEEGDIGVYEYGGKVENKNEIEDYEINEKY